MFKNGPGRYWLEVLLGAGVLIGSFVYHQKLAAAAPKMNLPSVPSLGVTVLWAPHWTITSRRTVPDTIAVAHGGCGVPPGSSYLRVLS